MVREVVPESMVNFGESVIGANRDGNLLVAVGRHNVFFSGCVEGCKMIVLSYVKLLTELRLT